MAEATKSLAAEIEAKAVKAQAGLIRAYELLAEKYGTWSPEAGMQFPDRYPAEAVEGIQAAREILSEIATLQSRGFEDGARKKLADSLAVYDAAERKRATASAVYDEVSNRMGGYPDIGEIMDRVGAEEACMRASLSADLARSKLIGTLRAALADQEKGDA